MLSALQALLDDEPGFEVVLQAATGTALVEGLAHHRCGAIVVEPWLRSKDGLDAIRQVAARADGTVIIALSRLWDDAHVSRAMDAGAHAYLPKSTDLHRIPGAILRALEGISTMPTRAPRGAGTRTLTRREAEVITMAAEGLDNAAIAQALFVSERTVKFHLQNAYRKLGVGNRTAAVAAARREGLIS